MDLSPEKHKNIKYPTLAAMAAAVALAAPITSCAQEAERTADAPMPPPEKKVDKQKPQRLGGAMAPRKDHDKGKKQEPQSLGGKVRRIPSVP